MNHFRAAKQGELLPKYAVITATHVRKLHFFSGSFVDNYCFGFVCPLYTMYEIFV